MPVSAFSRTYIDITTAEKPLPFVRKLIEAPCVV